MTVSGNPQILAELRRDHRHFARVIVVLEDELKKIRKGESEDWKLLADSFEYFEAYTDLVHHPHEDVVYCYCRDVCAAAAPALEGLELEHARITGMTTEMRCQLDEILADGMLNREALVGEIENYLTMQKAHMLREEANVFPVLLQGLAEADWKIIGERVATTVDPLFDASSEAYGALYRRIVSQER